MKDDKTLEAIVKRCQGECYIGIVGPVTSTGNCCIFNNPKGLLIFSKKQAKTQWKNWQRFPKYMHGVWSPFFGRFKSSLIECD